MDGPEREADRTGQDREGAPEAAVLYIFQRGCILGDVSSDVFIHKYTFVFVPPTDVTT